MVVRRQGQILMFDFSTRIRRPLLVVALFVAAIGVTRVSAQEILHVYGSEGPYPAMREAATV
ncbi:MAG: hypothetical protein JSU63_09710, partial [Phycisphaerales bacterium]